MLLCGYDTPEFLYVFLCVRDCVALPAFPLAWFAQIDLSSFLAGVKPSGGAPLASIPNRPHANAIATPAVHEHNADDTAVNVR